MSDDALFSSWSEPVGTFVEPAPAPARYPDLRAHRIEFSSRGDRVAGRLLLPPDGEGPFPLVLLQHGARGSKESPYLEAAGGPWARAGAAVASIDFPLHGERGSAKFAALLDGLAGQPALTVEVARQAVVDLRRALDALGGLAHVDAERVVYAGFSMGGILGATFCGVDPRPRAAALALAGGGLAPPEVDPTRFVGSIAPRPLLLVGAERDARIPRAAARALFEAAREPVQELWFDGTHDELPGAALKAMWEFLRPHLGLEAARVRGVG